MEPKRYDTQMIRDFLAHLRVEVRVAHFESTPNATQLNLEEVERRRAFAERYRTNLLPKNRFDGSGMPRDRYDAACEALRASLEARYAEWLDHLEGLQDLFDDALACAARGGVSERVIKVAQFAGNLEDE